MYPRSRSRGDFRLDCGEYTSRDLDCLLNGGGGALGSLRYVNQLQEGCIQRGHIGCEFFLLPRRQFKKYNLIRMVATLAYQIIQTTSPDEEGYCRGDRIEPIDI